MADDNNALRSTDRNSLPHRALSEEALSLSGAHDISDPKKRDSVVAFTQYAIITLSFIYAISALWMHWDSSIHGYKWQITEWELAVIFTPLGGGTIWSWLTSKFKK